MSREKLPSNGWKIQGEEGEAEEKSTPVDWRCGMKNKEKQTELIWKHQDPDKMGKLGCQWYLAWQASTHARTDRVARVYFLPLYSRSLSSSPTHTHTHTHISVLWAISANSHSYFDRWTLTQLLTYSQSCWTLMKAQDTAQLYITTLLFVISASLIHCYFNMKIKDM